MAAWSVALVSLIWVAAISENSGFSGAVVNVPISETPLPAPSVRRTASRTS